MLAVKCHWKVEKGDVTGSMVLVPPFIFTLRLRQEYIMGQILITGYNGVF